MNNYIVHKENDFETIAFCAVAENEEQVVEMAKERGINIADWVITRITFIQ